MHDISLVDHTPLSQCIRSYNEPGFEMTSSLIFELLLPHNDLVARPLPLFHFIPLSKVPLLQQLGSDQFKSMCAENFEGMFRKMVNGGVFTLGASVRAERSRPISSIASKK